MKKLSLSICFIACLLGCQVGPKYKHPPLEAPLQWKHSYNDNHSHEYVDYWWEIFHDPRLNQLEIQAIRNNKDVFAAFERITQARALAGVAESDIFPQVNLEANYLNRGILWMLFDPVRVIREHRRRDELPVVLNFEFDLWGKLTKAYESSVFNALAVKEAYYTTLLVLTTDLASSYFQLRTYDSEVYLLYETTKSREKALEIAQSRYQAKIINYSAVAYAEFEYKNTQVQYLQALRLRNLEENKMALLLGIPASDFAIESLPLKGNPPTIPAGLPSDILTQRPDIAEAERTLASLHAKIGVAYASFFPSVSLTGALGFSSPELKDFLTHKGRLWALGADAFQPIFDAGRLCSNLKFAKARFREAYKDYQQQVLTAFKEVEDALANLEGLKMEFETLEFAVRAANQSEKIAFDRYIRGITYYLDVVESEREVLDSERNLIGSLGQRYLATVQLIKALGGCWRTDTPYSPY